ncbi:hypothetical protein PMZ80_008784 [Knufia obscura]|uniref:N-acetyltransferase domain-containing protein n=2 Tax=Knufia TaxID=430999 RepID=A0AAN8IPN4_9EURO|nr:hypothetical protein PMZ80_008784 [Knufia obscura]KAK5955252.1 hypothetical protein OHC33_003934 [Knufia fluminis]
MHIRPVEQKDLHDFARVNGRSMWNDESTNYMAPHRDKYPDSYFSYSLYRTKIRWYRGELLLLAVSDANDSDWTGQEVILGYCCYTTTVDGHQKPVRGGWLGNWFERFALDCYGRYAKLFGLNRSCDQAAEQHLRRTLDVDMGKLLQPYLEGLPEEERQRVGGQHWALELLGTHPDFRRRGVGKMTLQWGFERAREHRVPLILIATVTGEKLYLSTGFREVSRVDMRPEKEDDVLKELDLGQGKGKGISWAAMVWEPENMRGKKRVQRPANQA